MRAHGINSDADLGPVLVPESLLLINRALDGEFTATDGIELIRQTRNNPHPPAMMLISNYPEAQEEAVKAGAAPGFGKSRARADGLPAIQKILSNS